MIGHLWRGMSRSDVKELGELLYSGEAGLVIVGQSKLDEAVEREIRRANRRVEKELKVDSKGLEKELAAAS